MNRWAQNLSIYMLGLVESCYSLEPKYSPKDSYIEGLIPKAAVFRFGFQKGEWIKKMCQCHQCSHPVKSSLLSRVLGIVVSEEAGPRTKVLSCAQAPPPWPFSSVF